MGGVFQIDIIHLPQIAKRVKGWVMRQISENSTAVNKSNYPIGNADGVLSAVAPQIKCSIKLRPGLILPEVPKVAWFHPVDLRWTTEPIMDPDYNPETNELKFNTVAVGSIAVVQDHLIDFCYKGWSLTPIMLRGEEEEVHYTVVTPRYTVKIAVRSGERCQLLSPDIEPLSKLREKVLEPTQLLNELKAAGINLMPVNDDAAKAKLADAEIEGLTLKRDEIERKVCEEVSYLCMSFDFKSSRWNNSIGKGKCCFQVKETDAFTGGSDIVDYNMGLIELDKESTSAMDAPEVGEVVDGIKCSLVVGGEEPSSRSFDNEILNDTQTELYMSKCVGNVSTPEGIARVEGSDGQVSNTVRSLLQLTRPFSFC